MVGTRPRRSSTAHMHPASSINPAMAATAKATVPGSLDRNPALVDPAALALGLLGTLVNVVGATTEATVSVYIAWARVSVRRPEADETSEEMARVTARAVPSCWAVAVLTLGPRS